MAVADQTQATKWRLHCDRTHSRVPGGIPGAPREAQLNLGCWPAVAEPKRRGGVAILRQGNPRNTSQSRRWSWRQRLNAPFPESKRNLVVRAFPINEEWFDGSTTIRESRRTVRRFTRGIQERRKLSHTCTRRDKQASRNAHCQHSRKDASESLGSFFALLRRPLTPGGGVTCQLDSWSQKLPPKKTVFALPLLLAGGSINPNHGKPSLTPPASAPIGAPFHLLNIDSEL